MNIFGKRKVAKPKSSAADTAKVITGLRQKLNMLEKRENHVQKKIDAQLAEARARSAKKDKKGALMALKRKKLYEKEIQKYQGARLTLEQQIITLESATVNVETFKAMQTGARAMETIHGELSSEKVEEVMDDISEQMAVADEISEAIGGSIGGAMEDDDELLAELDELDELEMHETMLDVPSVPSAGIGVAPVAAAPAPATPAMPDAPDAPIADADEDEMAALRELEAGLA